MIIAVFLSRGWGGRGYKGRVLWGKKGRERGLRTAAAFFEVLGRILAARARALAGRFALHRRS
jgi:hypothetical protein